MSTIIKGIIEFFAGGVGNKVGNAVGGIAQLAVFTPAILWLVANKDDRAVTVNFMCGATFTWGETIFWCVIGFFIISVIKYTRPGNPSNRDSGDMPGSR